MNHSPLLIKPLHLALLTVLGLLPWAVVQLEMALNTNHAWLFVAAQRLLEGGNHLQDVYEPNPPLSILIYFPAVLITKYFSIAADYSIYIFGIMTLGFSTAALWFFLRPLEMISRAEKSLICAIYVIAGCIIPSNLFFAERDEFVFWGLVPFMVAQLMVTRGYAFKGLLYPLFLFITAVLILVKPHYIIFPALLFLHRLAVKRDIKGILKAPDVWAMIAACLMYVATVLVFFPDYLQQVLPSFIQYYISYTTEGIAAALVGPGFLAMLLLTAIYVLPSDKIYTETAFALLLVAALAFGLYVLQMKGFGYHLIPGKLFIFLAGCTILYGVSCRLVANDTARQVLVLVIALAVAYVAVPLKTHSQTHESYAKLLLPETVKSCGSPCPFFIFAENMEMIWQTSVYTGETHASRFPGLWWLHSMLEHGYKPEEQQKYAEMVAEDLERYDPKMLIIATNLKTVHGETFSFIDFFSNNENFKRQMSRYKLEKKITDDRGQYFKGTTAEYPFPINYDVYLRK